MVAAWNSESGDNIGGALRSTDSGASWFDSSTGLPAFFRGPRLCASPSNPQNLLYLRWLSFQSGGLFRTTDGGVTWASTGWTGNQTVGDVACHPVDDQMLFVTQLSGGDAVLRSLDGGATFAPFANGLENAVAPVNWRLPAIPGCYWLAPKGAMPRIWQPGHQLLHHTIYSYTDSNASPTPTPTLHYTNARPTPTPRPRPTPQPRPTPPG